MSGDHLSSAYDAGPQRGITRAEITFDTKDCSEQMTDQLLGAMHRVLSAQRRVQFTIQSDGAELEGDPDEIFRLAMDLNALPSEIGMPNISLQLSMQEQKPVGGQVVPGPASWIPHQPKADAPLAVEIRGLTKVYDNGEVKVRALQWIDLEIRKGEFVAVMGPSGSGKSTLMHILGALETPSSGIMRIGNTDYSTLSDAEQTRFRRDHIGFVFQFFNLFGTLTAEENVMLPSLIAGENADALRGRARELLGLVNLEERADHLPSQLSGGEQQRVSVARSLMREPELILADEPTGNLDSKNSAGVLDLLTELQREQDRTILMVTHDPVAASRASRVVFLRDGQFDDQVTGGDPNLILEYFAKLGTNPDE
jgi:putative ABC transport system ATP-binding protein